MENEVAMLRIQQLAKISDGENFSNRQPPQDVLEGTKGLWRKVFLHPFY